MMDLHIVNEEYEGPRNLEVEQGLLGALMLHNEALQHVPYLEVAHFSDPLHRRIYDAIKQLVDGGQQAIPVTLKSYLDGDSGLTQAGGPKYLAQLSVAAVRPAYVQEWARTVVDLARRREAAYWADQFIGRMHSGAEDLQETLDGAQAEIISLADADFRDHALRPISEASDQVLEHVQKAMEDPNYARGAPTGIGALDRAINGLQPEHLVILAARPGMGKSALAATIALACGEAGLGVMINTLEMPAQEYAIRMQSCIASRYGERIEYDRAMRGDINADELARLQTAADQLRGLPININSLPALRLDTIRAEAARTKRRMDREGTPLGAVIIDHMGLIKHSGDYRGKVEQVGEVSNGLKALAKDLGTPVVALSQLSRGVEGRDDKRPTLSDLRWAGEIEQDADEVLFIYREHYYLSRAKPTTPDALADWHVEVGRAEGFADIIHAKQRMGQTGTVKAVCDIGTNTFRDMDDFQPELREAP